MPYYQPTELWTEDEVDVPTYGVIKKAPCLELVGLVASWLQTNNYVVRYEGELPVAALPAETIPSLLLPPYNTGATKPALELPPNLAGAELDSGAKKVKGKLPTDLGTAENGV